MSRQCQRCAKGEAVYCVNCLCELQLAELVEDHPEEAQKMLAQLLEKKSQIPLDKTGAKG